MKNRTLNASAALCVSAFTLAADHQEWLSAQSDAWTRRIRDAAIRIDWNTPMSAGE